MNRPNIDTDKLPSKIPYGTHLYNVKPSLFASRFLIVSANDSILILGQLVSNENFVENWHT